MRAQQVLTACACLLPLAVHPQVFEDSYPPAAYGLEMTNYFRIEPTGVVADLQKRIEQAKVNLEYDARYGYLPSLLKELKVPLSSQLLVFSKTSLQRTHISPKSPRAVFFNDRVYVAWIPDAPMIEIQSFDPKLGAVFYTLEQKPRSAPRLERNNRCLECHVTPRTLDVPGPLVRSFKTSSQGEVDLLSGGPIVNHRTPMADRWGGWFVTGTYGKLIHRGNMFSAVELVAQAPDPSAAKHFNDLSRYCDLSMYPRSSSDIVALLVFEHQAHMENLLIRLHYEAEAALRQWGHVRSLNSLGETFLKYLLFADEAPLPGPIEGCRDFSAWFEAQGPKDKQGRSLRQLDLRTRLFKFPCSYLIYSAAFDQLPYELRKHLYRRLWAILTGEDRTPDYQKIPAETKQAVFDILTETKPGLPVYWNL